MVQEIIAALMVRPGGLYVDCTLGEAGHSVAILEAVEPSPRLLGIDLDGETLDRARYRLRDFQGQTTLVHGSFANVGVIAGENGFQPADGVLLDLGISSLQLETGRRGFSFQREARLDMRFDPNQPRSAHDIVNGYPETALAQLIFKLGEERKSRRIARAIVRNRPIDSTTRLAEIVSRASGGQRGRIHPATRTFQAIRMAVNGEIDNIGEGLDQAISILRTGGRLAVISYHSIEDRLVKNIFRRESSACICPPEIPECVCGHVPSIKLVNRRVIKPSREEVRDNPRSRSSRLRVVERI